MAVRRLGDVIAAAAANGGKTRQANNSGASSPKKTKRRGRPKVEQSKPKYPWFKFWPDAWLSDAELSACSMTTQGVWINLLAMIHKEADGGSVTKSVRQFAKALRLNNAEVLAAFDELAETGTAEIQYIKLHPQTGELLVDKPVDKYAEKRIKLNLSQMSRTGDKANFSDRVFVSVLSRRMHREQQQRDYDRIRKRRQRGENS